MATDDDDAATLRERVRELEATVAQQQDTIQQLMPSRRAILAGGAGLVGGAALTGQASAQSAAGQVGTASEPVDVEAATVSAGDVNTDSVNTDSASVTNQLDAGSVNTASILGDSTLVGEQTRQTDTSIITADTYQTAYDNTSFEEPSGHFSGGVFNPPRDGYYVFFGRVEFRGNTVADDVVRVRWRNTTDSTNVARTGQQRAPSSFYVFQTFLSSQLSANDSYEIQATNRSSDFTIDNSNTYCTIFRIR